MAEANNFLGHFLTVVCDQGSFRDVDANTCIQCPVNTFQNESGQTVCLPCPDGKITLVPGINSESLCKG